jgi:hypothetical protein
MSKTCSLNSFLRFCRDNRQIILKPSYIKFIWNLFYICRHEMCRHSILLLLTIIFLILRWRIYILCSNEDMFPATWSTDVCLWLKFEHIMFFTQLYMVCSRTIHLFCVGERWDSKKYCILCCIKRLILFFINILTICDIYNLKDQF